MSDDEDTPQLSKETLAILNEFLEEKNKEEVIAEDWQLSQFWYDDATTQALVAAAIKSAKGGKIALLSCPTLMQPLLDQNADVWLLEFDNRFACFESRFSYYDYRQSDNIPESFRGTFDLVIADPPFLSSECLTKALSTVQLLVKDKSSSVILCTGALMETLAFELAELKPCSFFPKHKNNLANEFRCYTNFGELPQS